MGIKIEKRNDVWILKQTEMIEDLVRKFRMEDCKGRKIPLDPGLCNSIELEKNQQDRKGDEITWPYQECIGTLLYICRMTRPDISYAVNYLSRFNHRYTNLCVQGVKQVIGYLKETKEIGLKMSSPRSEREETCLRGYADASFAPDTKTRKSVTGYAIFLNGCPIMCRTKGQNIVTSSTTEAEYVAATSCIQDLLYYKGVLKELDFGNIKCVLEQDNNGTISHLRDSHGKGRTRHLDIKLKWCQQYIEKEEIQVNYCPTGQMIADMFTKALSRERFENHRSFIVGDNREVQLREV